MSNYLKPEQPVTRERRRSSSAISSGLAEVTHGKDKFMVQVMVDNYLQDELSIKTEDGKIVLIGKNKPENHKDSGVLKSMERKFAIPPGMNADAIKWEIRIGCTAFNKLKRGLKTTVLY